MVNSGDHQSGRPLRVFVDPSWVTELSSQRVVSIVENLVSPNEGVVDPQLLLQRDHFIEHIDLSDCVELVDPGICDFVLCPVMHLDSENDSKVFCNENRDLLAAVESVAVANGKPVLVHGGTKDVVDPKRQLALPFSRMVYLSMSLLASRSPSHCLPYPYFTPDYLAKYYGSEFQFAEPSPKPTVGFVGFAPPIGQPWCSTKVFDIGRFLMTYLDGLGIDSERIARWRGTNMKHAHRLRAIVELRRSKAIETDFTFRPAGSLQDKTYYRKPDDDPFNRDYYANMRRNLYNICCRGTENYSIRFYETLCLGRIPIVVDTDIRLPFDSWIDYSKHCVIIPKSRIRHAARIVREFHDERGPEGLKAVQIANRRVWKDYLSVAAFYRRLANPIAAVARTGADCRCGADRQCREVQI